MGVDIQESVEDRRVVHLIKRDVAKSSRVLMQCYWYSNSIVLHKGRRPAKGIKVFKLTLLGVVKAAIAGRNVFVVHEQGALWYLWVARIISFLAKNKNVFVFDIHDILERVTWRKVGFYYFIKNRVNLILERLTLRDSAIRLVTVSAGLSNLYYLRCGRMPSVVRNVPSPIDLKDNGSIRKDINNLKEPFVYFGFASRFPFKLLPIVDALGERIFYYGPNIGDSKNFVDSMRLDSEFHELLNSHRDLIVERGEFVQEELKGILGRHRFLLICDNENTDNIKWSLPNKIFQALAAGLKVVACGNFEEARDFFRPLADLVLFVNDPAVNREIIESFIFFHSSEVGYKRVKQFLEEQHKEARATFTELLTRNTGF